MTGNRSGHLLRPDIVFFGTIHLGKYLSLFVWTKQSSHALNVVINPYKLTLRLTASRDKAFLVKSIQDYSRHCTHHRQERTPLWGMAVRMSSLQTVRSCARCQAEKRPMLVGFVRNLISTSVNLPLIFIIS